MFGLYNCFQRQPREYNARSKRLTTLVYISMEDVSEIIS